MNPPKNERMRNFSGFNILFIVFTLLGSAAFGQGWETTTEEGSPKVAFGAAVQMTGGDTYVFGGIDQNLDCSKDVYYQGLAGYSWENTEQMPEAVAEHTSCISIENIYLFGGKGDPAETPGTDQVHNHFCKYDPEGEVYTFIMEDKYRPSARSRHASIADPDGDIYILGGLDADGKRLSDFWSYDESADLFTELYGCPHEVYGQNMVYYDGMLYILDVFLHGTRMFSYNLFPQGWQGFTPGGEIPNFTPYASAVHTVNGRCYKFGGESYIATSKAMGKTAGFEITNQAWKFDCSTETWTRIEDMPEAVMGSFAVYDSLNQQIKVYGGMRADSTINDKVFVYRLNPTDITDYVMNPDNFSLSQNYPNPFNPATTIDYSVPGHEFVNLKIYDLLGKERVTLVSEDKSPGNYSVVFDASGFSSGIYCYQLQAGQFSQIRKFVAME